MRRSFVAIKHGWYLFLMAVVSPVMLYAQDPGDDPDVPLDGGLAMLIAAGVGYGVLKAREYRNGRKEPAAACKK